MSILILYVGTINTYVEFRPESITYIQVYLPVHLPTDQEN